MDLMRISTEKMMIFYGNLLDFLIYIYIYYMNHYGDIIGIQWNIASGKLTQLLNIIILP